MIDLTTINPMILFGAAGFVGAGIRGLMAYYKAKQKDKKLEFDPAIFMDTAIQGIGAGILFATGLPATFVSLGVTALASAGVDTYTNKAGIKIVPVLRDIALKSSDKKKLKK